MTSLSPNTSVAPRSTSPSRPSLNDPAATPPVYAAFSPSSSSHSSKHHARTTLLVHQKSPLLVATPPQITRALAYSHPFISPISRFLGLVSWSTNDPWESFLLVCAFWAVVLYGDLIVRTSSPLLVGVGLILGMYNRRFSPLSSTGWATPQSPKPVSESSERPQKRTHKETQGATSHHRSLDEIVATMQTFTTRCNILLEPFLTLTDFLSTQHTATTATTRPALTALFTRLVIVAPIWWALSLSPFRLVTTRRVVLTIGTLVLSWHSRPARVSRVILWRSKTVRRAAELITGLTFSKPAGKGGSSAQDADKTAAAASAVIAKQGGKKKEGIRFTFALYENQRRWLGIGWTHSTLSYERAAWTDEYLNPVPSKDSFHLPDVPGGLAKWRWFLDSAWTVADDSSKSEREAAARKRAASGGQANGKHTPTSEATPGEEDEEDKGWIYYDNKWQNGRRGVDGWGKYTRRRKWVRDAELVEATPSADITPTPSPRLSGDDARSAILDDKGALPQLDGQGGLLTPERAAGGKAAGAKGGNAGTSGAPPDTNSSENNPKQTYSAAAPSTNTATAAANSNTQSIPTKNSSHTPNASLSSSPDDQQQKHSWFRRRPKGPYNHSRSSSQAPSLASTTAGSTTSVDDSASVTTRASEKDDDDGGYVPMRGGNWERAWNWGVGDEVGYDLG